MFVDQSNSNDENNYNSKSNSNNKSNCNDKNNNNNSNNRSNNNNKTTATTTATAKATATATNMQKQLSSCSSQEENDRNPLSISVENTLLSLPAFSAKTATRSPEIL